MSAALGIGIANSISKCDKGDREVEEYLMRGFAAKRLSGTMIEAVFDHPDWASRDLIESDAFREVWADQAIGVFVACTLSRPPRIGEIDVGTEDVSNRRVLSEFTAVVQGKVRAFRPSSAWEIACATWRAVLGSAADKRV